MIYRVDYRLIAFIPAKRRRVIVIVSKDLLRRKDRLTDMHKIKVLSVGHRCVSTPFTQEMGQSGYL